MERTEIIGSTTYQSKFSIQKTYFFIDGILYIVVSRLLSTVFAF